MFGRKSICDDYARAIAEINEGRRREPQHGRPEATQSRWGPRKVGSVDQHVFEEFSWFGATLDWSTAEAWSMKETSDTMRRAWYLDSPEHGRRWIIHYNALKLGWIEVSAAPKKLFGTADEFRADPAARIDMELHLMRFIPSEDAFGLLYQVSFLMQSLEGGYDLARERAKLAAESVVTHYMWDVMRAGDQYVPELDFTAEGPYAVYRDILRHWKETGFNPFTRKRA